VKAGWTSVALGDVAVIERQGVDPAAIDGATLYLGLEHIESGGRIIGHSTVGDSAVASTKFRFDSGHVLFGKLRPYLGKIASPDFAGVCSTDILPVRPKAALDRGYLTHYLRQPSVVEYASSRAAGANLPRLSPSELARFELPLPPIEEQRRLAAILDGAQLLRSAEFKRLTLLAEQSAAIVAQAAASASTTTPLGSLLAAGPSNGLYKPAAAYGHGTRIVRIDSFDGGKIDQTRLKRLNLTPMEQARFGLDVADIVINRVNAMSHVGKAALVGVLDEPTVYESNMMRIRIRDDWRPEFIAAWLMTQDARRQIRACAKQAINQASINGRDVKALQVPVLSAIEQRVLISRLARVEAVVNQQRRASGAIDCLFRALQARAFSGRL